MRFSIVYAAAVFLLAIANPSAAATLRLDAESRFALQSSDFSIVFDDLNGNREVSLDEIISFSGFTSVQLDRYYPEVLRLPKVAGFVDGEVLVFSSGFTSNSWLFADGVDQRASLSFDSWTYGISDIAPVPLPASGLMLLAGFGLLGAAKRRNKASRQTC